MVTRIAHATMVTGLGLAVAVVLAGCGSKAQEAAPDKVEDPAAVAPEGPTPQAESHAGHKHEAGESHEAQGTMPAADTAARKADAYPLDVCVVSGEKLGTMGEAVTIQHEGRTVKFCCQGCVATFKKDPATYLAKLDKAAAAKKAGGHEGRQH